LGSLFETKSNVINAFKEDASLLNLKNQPLANDAILRGESSLTKNIDLNSMLAKPTTGVLNTPKPNALFDAYGNLVVPNKPSATIMGFETPTASIYRANAPSIDLQTVFNPTQPSSGLYTIGGKTFFSTKGRFTNDFTGYNLKGFDASEFHFDARSSSSLTSKVDLGSLFETKSNVINAFKEDASLLNLKNQPLANDAILRGKSSLTQEVDLNKIFTQSFKTTVRPR